MGISPYLQRAYELARQYHTHPNPRVGAVVVDPAGEIVGEGSHLGPGHPHAEIAALDAVTDAAGCTVYVSLEPCTHHGHTPPCVDRLIAERVARVVIGTSDPDPKVSGRGVTRLRGAGVEVYVVDDPGARRLDPAYFHHRETGMPLVTIKYAMTLDGSIAARDGSSKWITSEPTRLDAHGLRSEFDAVAIGAGTLASDDPRLDVRIPGYTGPQPRPVVLAGKQDLPGQAQIWDREPLIIATAERVLPSGELVLVPGEGRPDPTAVCHALTDRGLLSVLLEGGSRVAGAWWEAGVVTSGVAYVGAKLGGGPGIGPLDGLFQTMGDARNVTITDVRQIEDDVRIDFAVGA